jgi:hypothetical protein
MKIPRFSLLCAALLSAGSVFAATSAAPSGLSSIRVTGNNSFLTGSTTTFDAGSAVTINGTFSGTPTGGTLNLSGLTLTLGAQSGSGLTNLNASNLSSGTVAAARLPALTGDITTSAGSAATTLATVNSNVGTYGSATAAPAVTVNGKGLVTASSNITITPAVGSITGLGSGVATALAAAPNATGGVVTFGGNIGAASGTSLNLTGNATVGDVVLGTSGPSVKSSINARAPRQGFTSDGAVRMGTIGTISAFGTWDYTTAMWVRPTVLGVAYLYQASADHGSAATAANGSISFYSNDTGPVAPAGSLVAGKTTHVAFVRAAGVETVYIDGKAVATKSQSAGNCTNAVTALGGSTSFSSILNGTILGVVIENRALSQAEITALNDTGVPPSPDLQNAGTESKPTTSTLVKWYGTGTISSATATSCTVDAGASGLAIYSTNRPALPKVGGKFRITLTITGTMTGLLSLTDGSGSTSNAVAITGSGNYEVTATSANSACPLLVVTSAAGGTISIDNVMPLGLLLYIPDQPGRGSIAYGAPGTAANITLGSGVSWAIPAPLTVPLGGGATLAADSNGKATLAPTSGQDAVVSVAGAGAFFATRATAGNVALFRQLGGTNNPGLIFTPDETNNGFKLQLSSSSGDGPLSFLSAANGEIARFTSARNLLIGTTTDGSSLNGGVIINGSGPGAASSSTSTGALRVAGGIGVTGNVTSGGNFYGNSGATPRFEAKNDGTVSWGSDISSGTSRGTLTWDTGKVIINSYGELDLRTSNVSRGRFTATEAIFSGNLTASGTATIGGGATVQKFLTATATLNFGSIAAHGEEELTITVTGAAVGDVVSLGLPASVESDLTFHARVSASNTVTVRAHNSNQTGGAAIDPASASYRVMVTKF